MNTNQIKQHLIALTITIAFSAHPAAAQNVPADSDYNKDITRTFVSERSGQALDSVNSILCMIDQTKYNDESLLGAGPYRALVDESLCQGRDSSENSGGSNAEGTSAEGSKEYLNWTVTSSRSTALAPQIVTFFVHMSEEETPLTIQGKLTITEGASDFNPLGAFSLHYKMTPDGFPNPLMRGLIQSKRDDLGRVVITQAEEDKLPNGTLRSSIKSALRKSLEGGAGSVSETNNSPGGFQNSNTARFDFAYNQNFFLRSKGGANEKQCLNRKVFETSAWRYGLYNSTTGARIQVNSGFPFNTEPDGHGEFGYIGYFGLGLPPGEDSLTNGSTVYRQEFIDGAPVTTPYTLLIKDGKLKKHTKAQLTLADLKNVPLEGFLPPAPGQNDSAPLKRLTWDGSSLNVIASASPSNGAPRWNNVTPPQPVTSSTTLLFGELPLFSQALGGQVRVVLSDCNPVNLFAPQLGVRCNTPNAATPVVFFKESVVSPDDATVPANLTCYDNCPKASSSSGMDKDEPKYDDNFSAHDYSFTNGILMDGANPAVLTEEDSEQRFGFSSGPLFDLTSNADKLACPWDAGAVCGWLAWSALDEFYTWETGPNSWNKFASLEDGDGAIVVFDPPKQIDYEYPATGTGGTNPTAVDQKFAGNNFSLQYAGFGSLMGIPGKCFNPENPADNDPDCGKSGRRWVPAFTIPAGSIASDAANQYLIKPLEVERRMSKATISQCSAVQLENLSSSWPNLNSDWIDPDLGTEPVLTDPPKVIAGAIQ
jgi:hypothetical protein